MKNKVYGSQIDCVGCKRPLVAKVLLNVYAEEIIIKPHFEMVCINCGFGSVITGVEEKSKTGAVSRNKTK